LRALPPAEEEEYVSSTILDSSAIPCLSDAELAALLRRYYRQRAVRERMLEFLGGTHPQNISAAYISGVTGVCEIGQPSVATSLPIYLEAGLEIDRSLWDRDSLIAHIDLEYHNFDNPAAAWLEPDRAFRLQQPVLNSTLRILGESGIAPLTLLSGRGFHLVWGVPRDSRAFRDLAGLGRVPASLEVRYRQPCSPEGWSVEPELGHAFAGLGLVMEFIWHRVLAAGDVSDGVSVQPAAIEVGPGVHGREIIAFDISEYGDPLHTRQMRVPFSAYLKPRQFEWLLGEEGVRSLLPIFEIPLSGMTPARAIAVARDPVAVMSLARRSSVKIPDASLGMENLLSSYRASEIHAFHERFYRALEGLVFPIDDNAPIPGAPSCLEWILDHPNDLLLKPAALQHVVRVLISLGWQPASIAQRVKAAYRKDCGWGDVWTRLDPDNRAFFYTRLFAGMILTGADKLIDFNCVSQREKGYCTISDCRSNLAAYREGLEMRRRGR
jgi:hypothetical protein